ncbi:type I polyketide synthase [Mitsuaria sp. GD03876]|uniref:type I polyketide synthase n=1 Tax=Mitsuaria sp. GD03876 TaxID=2975399 RepID=UPI00244AF416|nr:type I polyketide synthase [Mitsuaria sp. GD03876]MDH0864407.1 SDR family oxidoreductase [Mitsuaria sp. GD03876]
MDAQEELQALGLDSGLEIAIVGMAGRFPDAADIDAFWRNLRDGVESVRRYTDDELRARGVPESLLDDPLYVKSGVPFDGAELFDAEFFGYTPRDAETLDPQHRVFLECAWTALEHAGYDTARLAGRVGVYAGTGAATYLMRHLLPRERLAQGGQIADLLGLLGGNMADALCTRVAYKLDLRGPAVTVQTACSTSLAAVHGAVQALLGQECDMALAGGVSLNLLQTAGYRHQPGAIFSPDGHCRAFDAQAAGTVLGSGAGVVVLKRLEDAWRDGDTIHAVIRGSAANNDGADKVGFTAPSVNGQAAVIRAAQAVAGVPARSIGYVEAHGTGTALGDPIEIEALTTAFLADGRREVDQPWCAIGSVKTNVGHLDAAAGVTGLIKTVLALRHRTLPPSLNFERPNPRIAFDRSPFRVNAQTRPWPRGETPRRAGVSAFGIGGTNVHVVLEEAPEVARVDAGEGADASIRAGSSDASSAAGSTGTVKAATRWQVLPLSARDETALNAQRARLSDWLREHPEQPLVDVAHTLQHGRRVFARRSAVVANEHGLAAELLTAPAAVPNAGVAAASTAGSTAYGSQATPEVVFLFPGSGAQHIHMGAALYRSSAVYRAELDACLDLLRQREGLDLRDGLFPAAGDEQAATDRLSRMSVMQPALFAVEYAMAKWWMHLGVTPSLMLGHSLGEYVAACLAGVFTLEDALHIVAVRGRLLQSIEGGAMTAVPMSEAELRPLLGDGCDLAAVNGEALCVLAGPLEAVDRAERALSRQCLPRRLHVRAAAHSALTEPIVADLERTIAAVPRRAPTIPFVSNLTGRTVTAEEACDPAYWGRHLRGTVRFVDGLASVLATPGRVLLEVGPGETLTGLARQHRDRAAAVAITACQAHPQQHERDPRQLAGAVATLWTAGVDIDWAAYQPTAGRRRVPLPGYPFQRRRHWIEAAEEGNAASTASAATSATPATGSAVAADSLYLPGWERESLPAMPAADAHETAAMSDAGIALLMAASDSALARALAPRLSAQGLKVVHVVPGEGFSHPEPDLYLVRPDRADDLAAVLEAIRTDGPVTRALHLFGVGAGGEPGTGDDAYFSLLALLQALERQSSSTDRAAAPVVAVIADGIGDVSGSEALSPMKAAMLGLAKVAGQEYPGLDCRVIDVPKPSAVTAAAAAAVLAELDRGKDFLVALRGQQRWGRRYRPMPADLPRHARLRRGGTYLITGGLGAVGMALARHLAREWNARIALLGRTPLPPKSDWSAIVAASDTPAVLQQKLKELIELEASGAEVLTVTADVLDDRALHAALEQVRARFGAIHGVIHAVVHPARGLIGQRSREAVEDAWASKIHGTRRLLDAVAAEPLDFVLLCSSIAALIGGLSHSDYAAANAAMDALAAAERQATGLPVVAVNWDAWRDVGIAVDMDMPDGVGLDEASGVRAFERILLGPDVAQVAVSTTALEARLGPLDQDMLAALDALGDEPPSTPTLSAQPRPVLPTAFTAPEGVLQEGLSAIWTEMLGIAPIGADDSLFDLGGDSLLAIRLLSRVRKVYGVELHPADFFRAPTIALQADEIERRLLDEIEQLPPDDETSGAPESMSVAP